MARPLRVEYPGAFYHVINRGNANERIFISQRDREKFLEYLAQANKRFSIQIHAYCLMSNHYHLLVETPEANLSRAMQWINVSYAAYFNRKRERRGHLFQGRFKSILVDADGFLKHLSRYIHLNPVRANMVESLLDYPWSSYRAFIGIDPAPVWLKNDWLLSQFGSHRSQASRNYQAFVEQVDIASMEKPDKHLVGGFILGGVEFVNWVKQEFLSSRPNHKEVPQLKQLKPAVDLDGIVAAVSAEFGCTAEQILTKAKKKNMARDAAIYLARESANLKGTQIGHYFGDISGAAVTMRHKKMAEQIMINKRLRRRMARIEKKYLIIKT